MRRVIVATMLSVAAAYAVSVDVNLSCEDIATIKTVYEKENGYPGFGICNRPYTDMGLQKGENFVLYLNYGKTIPQGSKLRIYFDPSGLDFKSGEWTAVLSSSTAGEENGDAASSLTGRYYGANEGKSIVASITLGENEPLPGTSFSLLFSSPLFGGNGGNVGTPMITRVCLGDDCADVGKLLFSSGDVTLEDLAPGEIPSATPASSITPVSAWSFVDGKWNEEKIFPTNGSLSEGIISFLFPLSANGSSGKHTIRIKFPSFVESVDTSDFAFYDRADRDLSLSSRFSLAEASLGQFDDFSLKWNGDEKVLEIDFSGTAFHDSFIVGTLPLSALKFADAPAGESVALSVESDVPLVCSKRVVIGKITDKPDPVYGMSHATVNVETSSLQKVGTLGIETEMTGQLREGGYFTVKLPAGFKFPDANPLSSPSDAIEYVKSYGYSQNEALFKITKKRPFSFESDLLAYVTQAAKLGGGFVEMVDGYEEDPSYPKAGVVEKRIGYLWVTKNGEPKTFAASISDNAVATGVPGSAVVTCERDPAAKEKLETVSVTGFAGLETNATNDGVFEIRWKNAKRGDAAKFRCVYDEFDDGEAISPPGYGKIVTVTAKDDAPLALFDGNVSRSEDFNLTLVEDENLTLKIKNADGNVSVTLLDGNGSGTAILRGDIVVSAISAGEFSFETKDVNDELKVHVKVLPKKVPVSITFVPKAWNLITVPARTEINASELSGKGKISSYVLYHYENGKWIVPKKLEYGKGYWIYANGIDAATEKSFMVPRNEVVTKEDFFSDIEKRFVKGKWNLFGTPVDITCEEIKKRLGASYVWTYADGKWYRSGSVRAGNGFYVK